MNIVLYDLILELVCAIVVIFKLFAWFSSPMDNRFVPLDIVLVLEKILCIMAQLGFISPNDIDRV